MTKYASDSIIVEFDNAVAGTLTNMTAYVDNTFDLAVTAETVDSTSFGDTWRERLATLKDGGTVTLTGWFDDTASVGPDAIFNAPAETRTLKITWGGSKTSEVETLIVGYKRTAQIGQYVRYEVQLQATGAVAEV